MLSRGRTVVLALACLGGALLVAWAAASGPVGLAAESGTPPSYAGPSPDRSGRPLQPSASASPKPVKERPPSRGPNLSWIRYVVLGLLVAGALRLVVRALPRLARMWRELPDTGPRDTGADLALLPGADELARVLAADRVRQLAAVDEGSPRNGIVGAWHRLEEITAASGLPRNGWETSAEFTVRMLKALDLDPRAAGRLVELYRMARFSSHELDERQRDQARSALGRLHDDVRQLR
ncbi:MAG: DUF4129 domain-containing protein [Marmoricola sp.]